MWVSGQVWCGACHRHWWAVRPIGSEPLECPDCHSMLGTQKEPIIMGGKPKTHTPYDRRLTENRDKPPHPPARPMPPAPPKKGTK